MNLIINYISKPMFNPLGFISKFIKSGNQKELNRIAKIVENINSLEENFKNLNDTDFPNKTNELKDRIKNGETLNQILPEAFALVREASKRSRKERHYDVQLIGGVVLHENKIAEMRTGEGKTLTIALSAYLNDFERKKNYNCDITYATNSELGFDYLRDNMKYSIDEKVQREHHYSIVDEIDSCLIDEAISSTIEK